MEVCVCITGEGESDYGVVGVLEPAAAEAWRLADTAHRSYQTFTVGELGEPVAGPLPGQLAFDL